MAIINRLARLFKADLHAVLDHIEEPELQLKQAIREMEEDLSLTDIKIGRLKFELDELNVAKKNAESLIAQTNDEIAICLESDNQDLARGLVRRKLETKGLLSVFTQNIENSSKALVVIENQRKEHSTLLDSMQHKAELLNAKPSNKSPFSGFDQGGFSVSDSDVEVALLKEQQKERQNFTSPSNAS